MTNGSVLEQANSQAPKESVAEVSLDSTQAEKTSTQGEVLVPSGAAIQSQLLPLGQASDTPWASYATMGFLILGMAATGLLIVKLRQGKSFGANKSERQMQIISSLALSPKRQLLLVKIRDKEVALASTESGITLLTELETPFRTATHLIEDSGNEEPRRRKVQQKLVKEEQSKMIAASSEITNEESAMARSEMLMGALKNLREKSMRGKQPVPQENFKAIESNLKSESQKAASNVQDPTAYMKDNSKASPTLGQTRAAFPKYLANAFEKEANRPTAQQQSDEAGNVTNMIRERLKELRPLA
jgi:flagellar biogenesis protein FliO